MPNVVDDVCVACDESTDRSEGLAERRGKNVDFVQQAKVLGDTSPTLPEDANAVRFVDHQTSAVLLLQTNQLGYVCDVSFHAEHAVNDNQNAPLRIDSLQNSLQICHVVVLES